jgi:uncharacterized repeat protein (TIGR04076 family)
MYKVKLTVIKREHNPDLCEEYLSDPSSIGPCGMFTDGQEFVVDGFLGCPEGMCTEAWQTLWPSLLAISRGGTFAPYTKRENEWVACCPDGLRPVVFRIERGEEMAF